MSLKPVISMFLVNSCSSQVIWNEYLYISRDNWWVNMDFGKANCSAAHPRRADVPPSLQDVWVAEVSTLHLSSQYKTEGVIAEQHSTLLF